MKLIKDLVGAITIVTTTLVPLKVHSVTVDTNQGSSQYECTQILEDKASKKVLNYTNFPFNKSVFFNIQKSGIIATFAPKNHRGEKIDLEQLASALGYERFAWVNYVEQDPHGIRDRNGKIVQTPYNDPPAGGYQYDAADNHPFYWDIERCDNCYSRHHYQHPKIKSKYQLVFEDHPSDPRLQSGESVNFVTHLVGVKSNSVESNQADWEILTTFSWKLTSPNIKKGRVSLVANNIDPLQLSPALLAQIEADGGSITNYQIAGKYSLDNHQCLQQNHQSQHLDGLD
ncbi:MAG: hypothetical protein QNJ70_01550 [Xenococcaceae cyanobacterium MO_207.B15]|nr:hypothetical protein [Xenococcaceae cyanobacterium MO_207.B15]MDJ0742310.1 hypothetical protein [Xenococcaceae cyanobacterium MO_167.B27]